MSTRVAEVCLMDSLSNPDVVTRTITVFKYMSSRKKSFYSPHMYVVLGDFASAIETLVTAISLIKQSKIANDDRCKILIASLQDTKAGIEDKSYGGGGGSRFVLIFMYSQLYCRSYSPL